MCETAETNGTIPDIGAKVLSYKRPSRTVLEGAESFRGNKWNGNTCPWNCRVNKFPFSERGVCHHKIVTPYQGVSARHLGNFLSCRSIVSPSAGKEIFFSFGDYLTLLFEKRGRYVLRDSWKSR